MAYLICSYTPKGWGVSTYRQMQTARACVTIVAIVKSPDHASAVVIFIVCMVCEFHLWVLVMMLDIGVTTTVNPKILIYMASYVAS